MARFWNILSTSRQRCRQSDNICINYSRRYIQNLIHCSTNNIVRLLLAEGDYNDVQLPLKKKVVLTPVKIREIYEIIEEEVQQK